MDYQFTDEGIRLATFKMVVENNAMLGTVISLLSRIYSEMAHGPNVESMPEEVERIRV